MFPSMRSRKPLIKLLWFQGIFYFLTGLWPLVHIQSFLWVTGPKTDHWLVSTVGVLIMAVSGVLLMAAWRREIHWAVAWLSVLTATGLAGVDLYYHFRGVIPLVYLGDALIEISMAILWFFLYFRAADD